MTRPAAVGESPTNQMLARGPRRCSGVPVYGRVYHEEAPVSPNESTTLPPLPPRPPANKFPAGATLARTLTMVIDFMDRGVRRRRGAEREIAAGWTAPGQGRSLRAQLEELTTRHISAVRAFSRLSLDISYGLK